MFHILRVRVNLVVFRGRGSTPAEMPYQRPGESIGYELWRFEKDGEDWFHAVRTKLPASQKGLKRAAKSRSKNGTSLDQVQKMGPYRLRQIDSLIEDTVRRNDFRWEAVWMQVVNSFITVNNRIEILVFDAIIAGGIAEIPRTVGLGRSEIIYAPPQTDEAGVHQPYDTSIRLPVIRLRLPALGQRFVEISPGQYDECLHFLLQNPAAADEDHLQYLTEARLSLELGNEAWTKSCMEKLMHVRDCKDGRLHSYFDGLLRSEASRNVFSSDLDRAVSKLKQASQ
jgi:hypothetical protein